MGRDCEAGLAGALEHQVFQQTCMHAYHVDVALWILCRQRNRAALQVAMPASTHYHHRYQSYQHPSMQLSTLTNLESFKFTQQDPRARIQLNCFSGLADISGQAGASRRGSKLNSLHIDVILARQGESQGLSLVVGTERESSIVVSCLAQVK